MRRNRIPAAVTVHPKGWIRFGTITAPCSLGRSGITLNKQEGDGATPAGLYPVRDVWFRPDKGRPATRLPCRPMLRSHGWCDDPAHPLYNRPVRLPFAGRHERLWRTDCVYDCIITIGHNDRPALAGWGSAIFIHLMTEDGGATEGCIALAEPDLLTLLDWLRPGDLIRVRP